MRIWHYYLLTKGDESWKINPKFTFEAARGAAIEQWEGKGLQFFRAPDPNDRSTLIVGARSDLQFEYISEQISKKLGVIDTFLDYAEMSIHELHIERTRLHEQLVEPYELGPESLEIFRERRADSSNPITQKIDEVESLIVLRHKEQNA